MTKPQVKSIHCISGVLLFVCISWIPQVSRARYMGEAYFESAMDLYQMNKYEDAVQRFKKFLELAPHDFYGHYLTARSLGFLGDIDNAIEYYERALAIKDDYDAHVYAGILFTTKGKYESALDHFKKALEIIPDDSDALIHTGDVYRSQKDFDRAIELYHQVIEHEPQNSKAYLSMGMALKEKGNLAGAIENLKKALNIQPDNAHVHIILGITLQETGDTNSAHKHFEKAKEIDPDCKVPEN